MLQVGKAVVQSSSLNTYKCDKFQILNEEEFKIGFSFAPLKSHLLFS